MAGTSNPLASHWPHGGDKGYFHLRLGPCTFLASETDPAAYITGALIKVPFDLKVKRAQLSMREGSWISGVGMVIKVVDDSGTPQTIVAELSVTTDHDAGTATELTIADDGPILAGGEIHLDIDPGDTNGEFRDLVVDLWCQPVYK